MNVIARILYRLYLATPHWQSLRLRILRRANYRCEWCHKHKPLDVHHTTYCRYPFRERDDDLVAVCRACHSKVHGRA